MGADSSTPTRRGAAKPEINITPLVDVVLVLLIIFMVVTPQMEAGATVQLPSIANPDRGNGALEPTTVTLSKDGRFFFEKEELPKDALLEKLRALHGAKPDARVVIKADVALPYGRVRDLFRACQDIGFPGASLQVIDKANKKG
ncbi:MAG: biopolymer transporter ExbD [Myxococcota bacterium]|jgi:biopolymer transport protein TolR